MYVNTCCGNKKKLNNKKKLHLRLYSINET